MAVSCVSQKPENNNTQVNNEHLTYFSFDHHNTMVMYDGENYSVSRLQDGRVHLLIGEGLPEEMEFYLNDTTILDELQDIVKAYKMDKYKEEYRPSMRITDGDSWRLYYKYDSKRSVSSGGYMAWPDNYREARGALGEYFQKWRKQEDKALAMDYFKFTCKNNAGRDIEYVLERGETGTTLSLRHAELGVEKTLKVENDVMKQFQSAASMASLRNKSYDYNPTAKDATRCTYFVRYNTGDTLSGTTGYEKYMGRKEQAIMDFFERWLAE